MTNDDNTQRFDALPDFVREIAQERLALAREHERTRQSPRYQRALAHAQRTVRGLGVTLSACDLAASRWADYAENFLFPRYFDDLVEAALAAGSAVENGTLNPARRELRYMLEVAVNAAYVDEEAGRAPFEQRLALFASGRVPKRNVDAVESLPLRMLGHRRAEFVAATRKAWVDASNYVHPTKRRMSEKLRLRAEGAQLGFETAEMLEAVAREIHDACSTVVVLALETIGPSFAGDLLVDGLDDDESWPFHASAFVAAVDEHFDYKHERKDRLPEHAGRRLARVGRGFEAG